jgi:hypothetical protein
MLSILCNLKADLIENDFQNEYTNHLLNNNYETILDNSELYKTLVKGVYDTLFLNTNASHLDIVNYLKVDGLIAKRNELLAIAISCLQCFVQTSWLGPPIKSNFLFNFINNNNNNEIELFEEKIKALLELDGESILMDVKNLHFIYICRIILMDFHEIISSLKVFFYL